MCFQLVTAMAKLPVPERNAVPTVTVDALLPMYDMMHAAARGAAPPSGLTSNGESWGPHAWASALEPLLDSAAEEERAGAALGCGGLLAGLAQQRSHAPQQHALKHRLQQRLVHLCAELGKRSDQLGRVRLALEGAAVAAWLSQQACGMPPPSQALWQCLLWALLAGLLSMDGIYEAARRRAVPQEASAALDARQRGRAAQLTGPISAF